MENKINYPFLLMVIMVTSIIWLTGFFVFGRPAGDNVAENNNADSLSLVGAFGDRTNSYQALHFIDANTGKQYLEMYNGGTSPLYKSDFTDAFTNLEPSEIQLYWSIDQSYFYFLSGSGLDESTLNVYDTRTGEKKIELNDLVIGQLPVWSDANTLFYQKTYDEFSNRPWGAGKGSGVSSVNLETLEITNVHQATETDDYFIDRSLCYSSEICTLRISKRYVENEEDWFNYQNPDLIMTERIL
ncbi:hypothetical protein KC678_02595 [Candidatus Dojkabacteria bacterium]|uniref:Uncharacterized protein n=1 Tax=Candidatus Dojkabacteria bacterium TaxID=2099670 RepID=A0A955ICP2_9BACT|nr:hypothetical protein [Candidatus Dojkabacteria bacterium]